MNTDKQRQLAELLTVHIFKDKEFVTGADLPGLTPLKQINSLVLYNLKTSWHEESDKLKSPFFDFNAPEVKEGLQKFLNTLSRFIKLSREVVFELLVKAISEASLLSSAPQEFVSEKLNAFGNPAIPMDKVRELSKYVTYHHDLIDQFIRDHSSIGKTEVLKGELKLLLAQYVVRSNLSNKPNVFHQDISSNLPEFELEDKPKTVEPVVPPPSPESKSFFDILDESETQEEEIIGASASELVEEVEIVDHPPFTSQQPTKQAEPESKIEHQTPLPVAEETIVATPQARPPQADPKLGARLSDRLTSQANTEGSLYSKISSVKVHSLQQSISLVQKEQFIGDLFKGDRVAYQNMVVRIEAEPNLDNALQFVRGHLATQYQWNKEQEVFKSLEKIIRRKYTA